MVVSKNVEKAPESKYMPSHQNSTFEKTTKKLTKNNSVYMGQNNRENENQK